MGNQPVPRPYETKDAKSKFNPAGNLKEPGRVRLQTRAA
jgi:hypothetical protein